ncbi:MAG: DNA-methyltransferase [Brevinemataceae bacterium]
MCKTRSPRNKTLILSQDERDLFEKNLLFPSSTLEFADILNKIICGDVLESLNLLPKNFIDLLIIDPPYNLSKSYHGTKFKKTSDQNYMLFLESWFPLLLSCLKPTASIYVCCDWQTSVAVYSLLQKYTIVRNRITWQREKGRGAKNNWKNGMEDIWFATVSDDYYFNVEAVKLKRKVLAPYYTPDRIPKDWKKTDEGCFRLTYPSNFWDDISIPYWSMLENTDHPTQKPEKLIAKLILASSQESDMVFDPFLGSGTTSVTAKKLGRQFSGIEKNLEYCLWAEKRLFQAETVSKIQGYNGVFLERNTQQK